MEQSKIRNFSIIAHIDHGKSTLADRILEKTEAVATARNGGPDARQHGSGARARHHHQGPAPSRSYYQAKDGEDYMFNLIDTPGHVDFNYEVSRSLAACEGAVLVVDASQGIEAQTLANTYLAVDARTWRSSRSSTRSICPAPTRIGSGRRLRTSSASRHRTRRAISRQERASTSTTCWRRSCTTFPRRRATADAPLQALIFRLATTTPTSGVIVYRARHGRARCSRATRIRMMATGSESTRWWRCGVFCAPTAWCPPTSFRAGEVGYITASIKNVRDTARGRHHHAGGQSRRPSRCPATKQVQPMVFCGMYPADGAHYGDLRDALEKLQLNDAALSFEPETSVALGFGFRCGFLGLLHMEIIQERLEREYNLDLITTAPSVVYHITKTDGESVDHRQPHQLPRSRATSH